GRSNARSPSGSGSFGLFGGSGWLRPRRVHSSIGRFLVPAIRQAFVPASRACVLFGSCAQAFHLPKLFSRRVTRHELFIVSHHGLTALARRSNGPMLYGVECAIRE